MFSHHVRDEAFLAALTAEIQAAYGLHVRHLSAAERGYYGETWKVVTAEGVYFAKLVTDPHHMARYIRSFPIVEELNRRGIDFISTIVKAADGRLFVYFQGHALGLFAFIDGVHTEDYPLDRLFRRLTQIYRVPMALPVERETFGLEALGEFEALLGIARQEHGDLAALFEGKRAKLDHLAQHLRIFSARCRGDESAFYLTSGDVGGNVILQGDRMFIIDWDYLKLAPVERDLWFYMRDKAQLVLIDEVLQQEGIAYRLREERLAYYCYSGYFYYLCEYLHCYFACPAERPALDQELAAYLSDDFWINDQIAAAHAYPAG